MILNDAEIKKLAIEGMINPFVPRQTRRKGKKVVSYGLSSFGYDLRVADEFLVYSSDSTKVIDPKDFDDSNLKKVERKYCIIPPNSFALARSVEYFRIPDDIFGIVQGKSTYARCGIITNVTPLEPGWEGHITLEISNTTPLPAKVYANEGLCQVVFFRGSRPNVTYRDRRGKYQGQIGITLPKV